MELTRPFAENGDRQDFPVDTQGDGTMSLQQGFGNFYGLPPEEGGLFIERAKFNQLMYLTTKGVIDNKNNSAKLLTQNLTWTVGSGGDYADLKSALNEASKYLNLGNFTIAINLKADYNNSLNVELNSVNLGFVKIDAEADLKNKQFYFSFKNSICPKFSNNIKVKLACYNCSIYLDEEATLDTGTNLDCSSFISTGKVNLLAVGSQYYTQNIFFNRSQVSIQQVNLVFSGVVHSSSNVGLIIWNCLARFSNVNIENNINRGFTGIWNIGSNTEMASLTADILSSITSGNIILQDRGGFISIQNNFNITGGNRNVTAFNIIIGSVLFDSGASLSIDNCTKSNITSNTLTVNGGFINK